MGREMRVLEAERDSLPAWEHGRKHAERDPSIAPTRKIFCRIPEISRPEVQFRPRRRLHATSGATGHHLDGGGNAAVGGGFNLNRHLGVVGEFQYNGLGNSLNGPDGSAHIWSLTANPTLRFHFTPRIGAYVIGGGGVYRRTVEFTKPTIDVVNIIDPWWGYAGSALVPANQISGKVTSTAPGVNIGGGLTFAAGKSGARFYVESRYQLRLHQRFRYDVRAPHLRRLMAS